VKPDSATDIKRLLADMKEALGALDFSSALGSYHYIYDGSEARRFLSPSPSFSKKK